MKWLIRTLLAIVAAFPTLAVACPPPLPQWHPHVGSFWYNGQRFADSYLNWLNPGGWSVSDPGYEHDLVVRKTFFSSCTSYTNLPNGYDDCPTAGVLETNPDYYAFSFGSFHARNIQRQAYYGSWNFSGGSASSTDYFLNSQEVAHLICPFDIILCMDGIRSQRLLKGKLRRGQPLNTCWPQDGIWCP